MDHLLNHIYVIFGSYPRPFLSPRDVFLQITHQKFDSLASVQSHLFDNPGKLRASLRQHAPVEFVLLAAAKRVVVER